MSAHDIVMAAAGASGAGPVDAQFNYVTMLLNGDGTNGAQNNTFVDSSSNNFTITRNGNATQGSFSPYGSLWSNYFAAASSHSLTITTNANIQMTSGQDFTIEAFVYQLSFSGSYNIWIAMNSTNYISVEASTIRWSGDAGTERTFACTPALNTWNHIAITRSGGSLRCFLNGVQVGSTISDAQTLYTQQASLFIAANQNASQYFWNGYVSNVRVVKGTALYTTTFTPSTTPLTAVSGTQLLTCQSNRFADSSSNAYAITSANGPSVQRFSPFNPTQAYTTATIGGSGYFDGAGEINTANGLTALQMGTGDYTYEMWVYHTSVSGQQTYFSRSTSGNAAGVYFYKDSSNYVGLYYSSQIATSSTTISANQWYHLAVTRASGTVRIFINGVQVATASDSTNLTENQVVVGGNLNNTNDFSGYICDARINKGTALYTSAFTPPTAPLAAVSGTSLLNNMTNAGIPDSAMMNDLQTVGNAQVSTSVKKYGTGSLAFDGTGDSLKLVNSPIWQLGSGNFTIECWVYLNVTSGNQVILSGPADYAVGSNSSYIFAATGVASQLYYGGGSSYSLTSPTISATTWTHLAWVRNGTAFTVYVNGTSQYTTTLGAGTVVQNGSGYPPSIGGLADAGTSYPLNGYIDDLRFTKGYARYTANFTPPTAALPTY